MKPAELLPLLYDELRRLAAAKMRHEQVDHTLDATALVHEAYMRLGGAQTFSSHEQFLRAAAVAMRRVLVDQARTRNAQKRGGGHTQVGLTDAPSNSAPVHVLALHEALLQLETHDAIAAELVTLRYFTGLGHGEAAAVLGLSRRQADGMWAVAKAWLYQNLHQHDAVTSLSGC